MVLICLSHVEHLLDLHQVMVSDLLLCHIDRLTCPYLNGVIRLLAKVLFVHAVVAVLLVELTVQQLLLVSNHCLCCLVLLAVELEMLLEH